jgi:hypothetical protein
MDRQKIIGEIKETLGKVSGFINNLPDDTLEDEWGLFKRFELQETSIPSKYRELMGLTAASVMRCWYCALFHKLWLNCMEFLRLKSKRQHILLNLRVDGAHI